MPYFTQNDLQYADYTWHSRENHDDPTQTHFPDNKLLATREGYEVLTFINAVARHNKWAVHDKAAGRRLERMLRQSLPAHMKGRIAVVNWVAANWTKNDY